MDTLPLIRTKLHRSQVTENLVVRPRLLEATVDRPVRNAMLDSLTVKRDDLVTGIALPTGGADS